ncbi:MAG TPA: DUF5818 domain-containing protein [Candidatus Acidoferrum sp.]|nr:DUF5818 domain-containing protein [Candidatus Acidoferrum sp.]
MKRENWLAPLMFILLTTPLMFSQRVQSKPSPAPPPDVLGAQLIAWSQVQKPQPLAQQSEPSPSTTHQNSAQQPPAAQTITGTIIKDAGRYVVKVSSNTSYELDDQERARQYEGKPVKITGTLDANAGSLHIISISIQLLS